MTSIYSQGDMRSLASRADSDWTIDDAAATYGLNGWASGYYGIAENGNMYVAPLRNGRKIDLYELIKGLSDRDINTPLLLRFDDLLRARMREIHSAFADAIKDNDYNGRYCLVYPIKVNQQRHLCEQIRDEARELGFGLEAGSKPELLAVLGLTSLLPEMPIVCNGFKDREYVEMTILARKLGRNIIPVVERFQELELIVEIAQRYGVQPRIGMRIKPASSGSGRWESSSGMRSKFGLSSSEALRALDYLKQRGMQDCLTMLHFHIGSQVCDIRNFKAAISELVQFYLELKRLGAGLSMIDVGGGLGVDYDGSRSAFESSVNYTLQDYADDVVYRIKSACDDAGIEHPMILSESGRAMVAHSTVMVIDVLGRSGFPAEPDLTEIRKIIGAEPETPQPILDLVDAFDRAENADILDVYHDALQARDEAASLFRLGYLNLPLRAAAERLYWSICRRIIERVDRTGEPLHDELSSLPVMLSDIYYANFSVFQSLPDSWAIDQLFPICPIHRLNEEPERRAIIADITCDSDGQIDKFSCSDSRLYRRTLEVHSLRKSPSGEQEPYYLGIFLTGAYQEVLGDLHNLFGDTHVVHVSLTDDGGYFIDEVVEGDTVEEVLGYAQYNGKDLERAMRLEVEHATKAGRLDTREGRALLKFYEEAMEGYTYLE